MRRERNDENYFVRPDGRVIPRCGYRLEEWSTISSVPMTSALAEGLTSDLRYASAATARAAREARPSAEVLEESGAYRVVGRGFTRRVGSASSGFSGQ